MRFEFALCKLNPLLKNITTTMFCESNILNIQDLAPPRCAIKLTTNEKLAEVTEMNFLVVFLTAKDAKRLDSKFIYSKYAIMQKIQAPKRN